MCKPHPSSLCQLNCVVMKGVNEDEICDFVSLTESKVSDTLDDHVLIMV